MRWDDLHGHGFVLRLRLGMADEYRRRHAAIWPEMTEALHASGIVFYEIFLDEAAGQVFGYMLRNRPASGDESPVITRWRTYMADVLEMDGDQPARRPIERVFRLAGQDGPDQASDSP